MSEQVVRSPEETFDAFVNGRLAKGEWTHEAHLTAAFMTLRDRTPEQALDFLRAAITAHNCGVGTPNDEADGYHETITRYYITAVSQANAATIHDLQSEPTCGRTAALKYWSRDLLFSSEARLGWVPPDLATPPWPIVGSAA